MPHGRVQDSGQKVAGQVKDPLVSAQESCDRAKEPVLGAKEVLVASVCVGSLPAILVHSVHVPWRIATVHKDDARM